MKACRDRRLLLLLLFPSLPCLGQKQEADSLGRVFMDSIVVSAVRYQSFIRNSGSQTSFDMSGLNTLPQLFGNADPVHYAQMLPGIQTNSEYRSGLNIEGFDSEHNAMSLFGVPIYNASHLLGFFSTFSSSHFSSMSISKENVDASAPGRLGGNIDMLPKMETAGRAEGTFTVGMISSGGTLRLPVADRTFLTASLRGSYLNLLYSRWLKKDRHKLSYSFFDANLSLLHQLSDKHSLLLDFYTGNDDGNYTEAESPIGIGARWSNIMGAAHLLYEGHGLSAKTTAYVTSYRNRLTIDIDDLRYRLPSRITDVGLKGRIDWKDWQAGMEMTWHSIEPQELEHSDDFNRTSGEMETLHSLEASVFCSYTRHLAPGLRLTSGARGNLFHGKKSTYVSIDPSARFLYDISEWQFSLSYALRHQYLFQTGFSDMGLPTEFWLPAGGRLRPQYMHGSTVSMSRYLFRRRFKLSADVFYKRLYHQTEYRGTLTDYLNSVYDIYGPMMFGRGENYGASVILNKCSGALNGWVSYTYTHARRTFSIDGQTKTYPQSHERPHELNVLLTYSLGKHWSFGGTYVFASGTPFTAAKDLCLLNNYLVLIYGEHNAARLRSYMRLDLSADYKWQNRKGLQHGINLSVYNATNRSNDLFYYLSFEDDRSFAYRPLTFLFTVLPSLSYSLKF